MLVPKAPLAEQQPTIQVRLPQDLQSPRFSQLFKALLRSGADADFKAAGRVRAPPKSAGTPSPVVQHHELALFFPAKDERVIRYMADCELRAVRQHRPAPSENGVRPAPQLMGEAEGLRRREGLLARRRDHRARREPPGPVSVAREVLTAIQGCPVRAHGKGRISSPAGFRSSAGPRRPLAHTSRPAPRAAARPLGPQLWVGIWAP